MLPGLPAADLARKSWVPLVETGAAWLPAAAATAGSRPLLALAAWPDHGQGSGGLPLLPAFAMVIMTVLSPPWSPCLLSLLSVNSPCCLPWLFLRVFGSSGLRVFGSSGLRTLMAAASASLALAACGGGDSTVQTQPQTDHIPPDTQTPPDCTAVPRPAGCTDSEPVVPMPFAPLGSLETSYAVAAIKKARFGTEQYPIELYRDPEKIQIAALKHRPFTGKTDQFRLGGQLTKLVKVEPSGDVDYTFELWNNGGDLNSGGLATNEGSFEEGGFKALYKSNTLSDGVTGIKLLTIASDDWTSKEAIKLDFDEPYNSAMKDFQVLSAEVDTDNDNENDATLYAELWTNYPSDDTHYMSGGIWLLVPNDTSQVEAYDFGGFVRSTYYGLADSVNHVPWRTATGTAKYNGSAAGLYASLGENNDVKISRLFGKVTINADFETARTRGVLDGKIHDLTLDGKQVKGELLLNTDMDSPHRVNYGIGNINGINFTGIHHYVILDGTTAESSTKALMGTIGGTGANGDTVVGTWGAYKVEEE